MELETDRVACSAQRQRTSDNWQGRYIYQKKCILSLIYVGSILLYYYL